MGRIGHHCGVLSLAVFYHEWSSARKSGYCTGTLLTPYFTKKRDFSLSPWVPWGKNPRIPSPPFPALLVAGLSLPCTCHLFATALGFAALQLCTPCPARMPCSSSYSCRVRYISSTPLGFFSHSCPSACCFPESC